MPVSQIQQVPTLYLLEVEVLVGFSGGGGGGSIGAFKENCHRLKNML